MEWQGEGVIVGVKRFGENAAIINVFTKEKGLHSGIVRGGNSRKLSPILQPGAQVSLEWRARLEDHLGSFRIEPLRPRISIMTDRIGLAALNSICGLILFSLPERMALDKLYINTIALLDRIELKEKWQASYAHWELLLLEELGYGLDLSCCAVNGATQDLAFVSPKSGRAVSKIGAGKWADQLLPLPNFLRNGFESTNKDEILDALKTTRFFLETSLANTLGIKSLPRSRCRLISALENK